MKHAPNRHPAAHVEPELSEARVERMWHAISAQLDASGQGSARGHEPATRRRLRPSLTLALGLAGTCVAACAVWWSRATPTSPGPAPALVATTAQGEWVATAEEGRVLHFDDGSTLTLGPRTQLRTLAVSRDALRVRLERGGVSCATGGRSQVVVEVASAEVASAAMGAEPSPGATRFHVGLDIPGREGPTLTVGVTRGRVEVRHDGANATLGAGETWTRTHRAASSEPVMEEGQSADSPTEHASREATSRTFRARADIERGEGPRPGRPTREPARPRNATEEGSAESDGATQLFEEALRERLAHRPAEAARAYAAFGREHPTDPRAPLAAFELGRLRLYQLGDAQGALQALDQALGGGGGGFFAEDAAAARVEALSQLGDAARCRAARTRFLATYATSVHRQRVSAQCGASSGDRP
ncbi:MAG: FecR domain-containing protein [Polyangiales bacterium]|nr:FecR domain-containing protein [Myxococcales bacterium]